MAPLWLVLKAQIAGNCMIEPSFFRDEQVLGFFHPSRDPASSRLLVICPPFFDEYRRSYRALSELAIACADQGVHAFRFDFFGTGESQGLLEQVSLADWIKDILAAIDEGIELSGADEVFLLGVRFSATLAAQVKHPKIKHFIFWDPIVSGKRYLEWLDQVNRAIHLQHKHIAADANRSLDKIVFENFHLSPTLKSEMAGISISPGAGNGSAPYSVISTNRADKELGFTNYEFTGIDYDWPGYHDGVLSQKAVLESIVRRVAEL